MGYFGNARARAPVPQTTTWAGSVAPGFRTGTTSEDQFRPGRPVMYNVPTETRGVGHQKYDSAPFPGGDNLQFNADPYQQQVTNYAQRQYGLPEPGVDLWPPDANYPNNGRDGQPYPFQAPIAANNLPATQRISVDQRPSEVAVSYRRLPLSRFMAKKQPVGYWPEMQFVHKLGNGLSWNGPARGYSRKFSNPTWVHREYFTGEARGPNAAPAVRERPITPASAPPQLQVSKGGLVIDNAKLAQKNININLANLYMDAIAPVSTSYSGVRP